MSNHKHKAYAKYSLKAHIILVTKYRKKLLLKSYFKNDIEQFIYDASKQQGCSIIEMESDTDHIHILLEYPPNISISEIVAKLKQYSTYYMWKYHSSELSKIYWKHNILWSDGYFASSIGQVSENTIRNYIKTKANAL